MLPLDSGTCPSPVTIDYDAGMVYWTDYCTHRIERMRFDGGANQVIQDVDVYSNGPATLFNDTLYWIQNGNTSIGIFATSKTGGEEPRMIYPGSSSQPFRDITVVHPSRQYIHPGMYMCTTVNVRFTLQLYYVITCHLKASAISINPWVPGYSYLIPDLHHIRIHCNDEWPGFETTCVSNVLPVCMAAMDAHPSRCTLASGGFMRVCRGCEAASSRF